MFLQGLQDLGYVEGRDLQITYRSSDGYQDRLPTFAEELVRLNPDVIVAAGLDAVVAARNATQTIPIVSATLADAIHLGLIANEARPTGNVTGLEPYVAGLPAKQMEFAREIMPGASKIGLLTNLSDPKAPPRYRSCWRRARPSKSRSFPRTPIDLRRSRARCRRWQAGAWIS
jgi:putative ABC transport system substrate-binding protein